MKAVYKCRLCGEIFCHGYSYEEDVAQRCMVELNVGIQGTVLMAPYITETHHCGGEHAGSLGMADFQGWKKEE